MLTKEIWSGRLREFTDDASVDEIWINDPDHVFVSRNGITEQALGEWARLAQVRG
ncbi:MAG: hypothetical protein O2926_01155 [Actinomycetota bacterium]|nr:hypothetical protein [Actinomycetota bacterium]